MITCTKRYIDFPFAHRQPNHSGHCSLLHGHNWSFEFEFGATELDDCGFVVDFGKLQWLKDWLTQHFDHTLVLNVDDPWLPHMEFHLLDATNGATAEAGKGIGPVDLAKIVAVPDCSCEGLAAYVLEQAGMLVDTMTDHRVSVRSVIVFEDSKNSAKATLHD